MSSNESPTSFRVVTQESLNIPTDHRVGHIRFQNNTVTPGTISDKREIIVSDLNQEINRARIIDSGQDSEFNLHGISGAGGMKLNFDSNVTNSLVNGDLSPK